MPTEKEMILQDLLAVTPSIVIAKPRPYNKTQDLITQINLIYNQIMEAKTRSNPTGILVHAYYLEERLSTISPADK
ncbi:8064_t:CDS:1, partial [Dentiscutata erythropus]